MKSRNRMIIVSVRQIAIYILFDGMYFKLEVYKFGMMMNKTSSIKVK